MVFSLHEKCGICGGFNLENISLRLYNALHTLQHRGQESAGIAISYLDQTGEQVIFKFGGMGIVQDALTEETIKIKGNPAIAHVRYSTKGKSDNKNIQPLVFNLRKNNLAVAHNGTLLNSDGWRRHYENQGETFFTGTDTEIIAKNFFHSKAKNLSEKVFEAVVDVKAAFSLLMIYDDNLIAVRDPWGFRPLSRGQLKDKIAFASETCAFQALGVPFVNDVRPGEITVVNNQAITTAFFDENGIYDKPPSHELSQCIFELIYFARPDSMVFGVPVSTFRERLGRRLAKEHFLKADVYIPVPDSARSAARGYAQGMDQAKKYNDEGLIRSHYIGRTFIQPKEGRGKAADWKFSGNPNVVKGKKVVVIDDSQIRGTNSLRIVNQLYLAGAKEIHLLISCPPNKHGCFYGIDMPDESDFVVNKMTLGGMVDDYLKIKSLHYQTLDGLKEVVFSFGKNPDDFCYACFDGKYKVR